jgi:hypothetical protein
MKAHVTVRIPNLGGEMSASRHGRFIRRDWALGIHWMWGWMGPRAGQDALEER